MAQITVRAERVINASPEKVRALVADYRQTRPEILTEHYRDYEVAEGGEGAGTVARWTLQATSKRSRNVAATVSEPEEGIIVETDANSSMVTTWTVRELDTRSLVQIETTWQGASGIGGFFERRFAPGGLRRIYDELLANLDQQARNAS